MSKTQEELLAGLLPKLRSLAEQLVLECGRRNIILKLTHSLRTAAEQDALYAKGRTVPGELCRHHGDSRPRPVGKCPIHPLGLKVTNARAGYSWHNAFAIDLPLVGARAFDIAIVSYEGDKTPQDLYDGPWDLIGVIGESVGLEWGGRWRSGADTPHFQLREKLTLAEARKGFRNITPWLARKKGPAATPEATG